MGRVTKKELEREVAWLNKLSRTKYVLEGSAGGWKLYTGRFQKYKKSIKVKGKLKRGFYLPSRKVSERGSVKEIYNIVHAIVRVKEIAKSKRRRSKRS